MDGWTELQWILYVVIGAVAGFLASLCVKTKGLGPFGYLAFGIIGSFVGGYCFQVMGIHIGGPAGTLITSILGAFVLLSIVAFLNK